MNQSDFQNSHGGKTQCARILARLLAASGAEVAMPELARIGAGSKTGFCIVHSRISDLRRAGHTIESRTQKIDGQMHSFYKLVPEK